MGAGMCFFRTLSLSKSWDRHWHLQAHPANTWMPQTLPHQQLWIITPVLFITLSPSRTTTTEKGCWNTRASFFHCVAPCVLIRTPLLSSPHVFVCGCFSPVWYIFKLLFLVCCVCHDSPGMLCTVPLSSCLCGNLILDVLFVLLAFRSVLICSRA